MLELFSPCAIGLAVVICTTICWFKFCRRSRSKLTVPRKLKTRILCFVYPCSVDGGVDAMKYAEEIFERCMNTEGKGRKVWQNVLYSFLGQDRVGLSVDRLSKELLLRRGEELKEKWDHMTKEDRTKMKNDYEHIKKLCDGELVKFHLPDEVAVITEAGDEHLSNLKAFLRTPDCNGAEVDMLYLMGHGIPEESAHILRGTPACNSCKRSNCWKWPLYDCEDQTGISMTPSEVTGNAEKGDIVVFYSGLLTPEWVVEQLRERKENTTIVIVVDSCYSGTWKYRMERVLNSNPLEHTRVLIQTACASDEVSYGESFTPRFVDLQKGRNDQDKYGQTPTFYDSRPDGYEDCEGCVRTSGFIFFNQSTHGKMQTTVPPSGIRSRCTTFRETDPHLRPHVVTCLSCGT